MWGGEQMPTEAGAGKVFGKAGERAHTEVAAGRDAGSFKVARTAVDVGNLKSVTQRGSIQSPVITVLCQQTPTAS